jgi:cytosine/adenosine deaminase-related metal-dependent hydrolase
VIFAKWVYQGGSRSGRSGQLLNNAGVAYLNGRIIKVGTYDEIRHWLVTQLQINKAELRATDLRDEHPAALLTPALVNAHTHLELSDTPRPNSPDGSAKLVPWLADMRQRKKAFVSANNLEWVRWETLPGSLKSYEMC